jgi:hypothetical protein
MSDLPLRPVAGRSAWKGTEMRTGADWIVRLSPEDLEDLDRALAGAKARGLAIGGFGRDEFPLPRLGPRLQEWLGEIRDGRGFVLVKGFPVGRHPEPDLRLMYWGMGTHLGTAISQNSYGDLLGDVRDEGVRLGEGKVRSYRTRAELKFHTDRCDLVGLLCFRKAKEGGASSLASSMAVYNEILATHPEYMPALRRGFFYINVEEAGDLSQWRVPVFSELDGVVSCRYSRNTIEVARKAGAALTELEIAALDHMDRLAASPGFRLDMELEPGDIQFVNSFTTLHARTEFIDHDQPDLKRRMLRLWLKLDPRRPLGPWFAEYDGVPKRLDRGK